MSWTFNNAERRDRRHASANSARCALNKQVRPHARPLVATSVHTVANGVMAQTNLKHSILDLSVLAHLDLKLHDITTGRCTNKTCQARSA